MQLPHPMQIDGEEIGEHPSPYLTFAAHGKDMVNVAVGVNGGLYQRERLTKFLRLVLKVLEA